MTESTTPTGGTPTDPTKVEKTAAKSARKEIKSEYLAEMTLTTELLGAAAKEDRQTLLQVKGIKPAFYTDVAAKLDAARRLTGLAVGSTLQKHVETAEEKLLKKALIAAMQELQKAAKQKAEETGDKLLPKRYGEGVKFYQSREELEQAANNFVTNSAMDDLPGIGAPEITAIQTALDDYLKIQADQAKAQSDATGGRGTLEQRIAELASKRRQLQHAADRVWPHTNPANAGLRAEFKLPTDKGLA
jgi:hypothetical protein